MRRRDFLTVTTTIAWASVARAQEPLVVIGHLGAATPQSYAHFVLGFLEGLNGSGFTEGRNLKIQYRWAEGQYDRLPSLAAELVSQDVAAIVCPDAPSAFVARSATKTIPIVFFTGADPVKTGLIDSFNHPGGNLTGVTALISLLGPKRLELLRELLPSLSLVFLLVNPHNPNVRVDAPEVKTAAEHLGVQLETKTATTIADIEAAFLTMAQRNAGALIVMADPFFLVRRDQLVAFAAHYAVPTIYAQPEFVDAGGLMSYGSRVTNVYHLMGTYTGKILKGAKPADLPVQQTTKLELVINLKTANALGLNIPQSLLSRAHEVIE